MDNKDIYHREFHLESDKEIHNLFLSSHNRDNESNMHIENNINFPEKADNHFLGEVK